MTAMRRGTWRPPTLGRTDSRLIIMLFVYSAVIRGLDYATGRDGTAASPNSTLATIEQAMPLSMWAAIILGGCASLLIGMAGRWTPLVITGHLVLAAAYSGLFFGLVPEYIDRSWFDGIRGAAGLAVPPAVHLLIATRTTAERRRRRDVRRAVAI